MELLDFLLGAMGLIVLLPTAWMVAQVACARPEQALLDSPVMADTPRPSLAVLIPAHNEAIGLAATLHAVQAQLQPQDRLLVVADNCQDDTAAIARSSGAEVLERRDDRQRGKGHALAAGFAALQASPRDVLVVVDADCLLAAGALQALAVQVQATGRPAQALYLMTNMPGLASSPRQRFSEFAWRLKNWVRPLGLHRLGLPCQLMGSGMGFPWALMRRHSLASGHLVEDMQLGLALAQAGSPPLFCPQALVTSVFPTDAQAQARQRTRWEHGHLSMITQTLPGLLKQWMRHPNRDLLAMALDLSIPPLSLLALLCFALLAVTALSALLGAASTGPVVLAALACGLFAGAVLLAWWHVGRTLLAGRDLARIASYLVWKLPLYARFITHRQLAWVRSQRHEEKH